MDLPLKPNILDDVVKDVCYPIPCSFSFFSPLFFGRLDYKLTEFSTLLPLHPLVVPMSIRQIRR